jgi:hypothetical protein
MRHPLHAFPVLAALALGSTGCIQSTLTNGQISATLEASAAFDTLGDYELARTAAQAGLVQFEGMHVLAPDNPDALFLLTKGWVGYAYAFVEDEMETADDAGDEDLADYHRQRARMAYDRAVFYGLQLLEQKDQGFEASKKNELSLTQWLSDHFTRKEDAAGLFWTGYGWIERVDVMKGDPTEGPAFVADLYIGVAMLERAMALDPAVEHYAGLIILGAYHARSSMAEMDQARQMFDLALAKSEGKNLMVELNYATKYACMKGDGALYQAMLEKVLQASDPDPHQRLSNAVAKRRAKRWLGKRRVKEACGIDLAGPR